MPVSITEIRRDLRQRRRALDARQQRDHAERAAARFRSSPLFLRYRRIGLYLANDGELDPTFITASARDAGKRLYLPVLRPFSRPALWFCDYSPNAPLRPNRFGILEPDVRRHPPVAPWSLDLLLLPLVGFDADGRRLGMGGGFYDHTLSYLRQRRHWRCPRLVGLAHECQGVERLPERPWDVPLDGVLTEERLLWFTP